MKIVAYLVSSIKPVLKYRFSSFKILYQHQEKGEPEGIDFPNPRSIDYLWKITVEVIGDIDKFEKILRENYNVIKLNKEE